MDFTEKKIIVKKSNGGGGIYAPILSCLLPIYFIYQTIKHASNWTIGFGTIVLIICILFFVISSIYGFDNYFDKKSVIEIDQSGITTKKYGHVLWQNIYDIQTSSFPGPRMSFYKIKYWLTDGETIHTIRFTSDITCKFDEIIDLLSFYTVQNNIRMTT
jgi:hypothetical protein